MFRKIDYLAKEIQAIFKKHPQGIHLRVDDLSLVDCQDLQTHLQNSSNFAVYILDQDITIDEAVAKRNEKQGEQFKTALCLLVPIGITHSVSSSIGITTLEPFNLTDFLTRLERQLLKEIQKIDTELKKVVSTALKQATQRRELQIEDRVDFLNAILDNSTFEQVGCNLWRIGLIPDKSEQFSERLKLNYNSVQALAYPLRPTATLRERLEATKLRKGTFMDRLEDHLRQYSLEPPTKNWLKHLENEGFDFSHWTFPTVQPSDLESIKLTKPIRKPNGQLIAKCGDLACETLDSPIIAQCGEKRKILVSWETEPKKVQNVTQWQVRLMPSKEDYDADSDNGSLPSKMVKESQRRATLLLDLNPEELEAKWVQVQVIGLDENHEEIKDNDNQIIEALSERIFLEVGEPENEDDSEQKQNIRTDPNLAFGYLKMVESFSGTREEWQPRPQGWQEKNDFNYFNVAISKSQSCRIGISTILHHFEAKTLASPDEWGRYAYRIVDLERFEEAKVTLRQPTISPMTVEWLKEKLKVFRDQREKLFKYLREQQDQNQGLIESADWENTTLLNRAKEYAKTYIELLEFIATKTDQAECQAVLQFFLSIDTVEFQISYTAGDQKALLVLPTHPYRMLWLAAYFALLNDWRNKLLELPKRQRKGAVNLEHLKEITPANIPAIVPVDTLSQSAENWYIFARNVGFFAALFLPAAGKDWSRITADMLRFLNYRDELIPTDVKPQIISDDIEKYLTLHPYCKPKGLKIGLINPGNAQLFKATVRNLLSPSSKNKEFEEDTDEKSYSKIQRLDISAIAHSPLPMEIEGLKVLREQFYALSNIAEDASPLHPAFTLSLTQLAERPEFINGNQHLSFYFDAAKPTISLAQVTEATPESISFYGLVNRWFSEVTSDYGQLKWHHWLAASKPERFERHPVDPKFTESLLKLSKQLSRSLTLLLDLNAPEETTCCLVSVIDPDKRGFIESVHQLSDWVLTIDRFFGADFFDSPNDPFLAELSEKYVIDYTPNFTEGFGDRLLVTTCWQEELTQIIAKRLAEVGLPQDDERIINLVKALKSLSGSYAMRLFAEIEAEEQAKRTLAIGITLHYLIATGEMQKAFLVPIAIHPELFDTADKVSDFLVVKFEGEKLRINCISTLIQSEVTTDGYGVTSPETLVNQVRTTEEMLNSIYFVSQEDSQAIGSPLERARLVMLMRFYLAKAIRYGFLDKDSNIGKLNEILSKVEASKITPTVSTAIYLIDPQQEIDASEPINRDGAEVIILGKNVLERTLVSKPKKSPKIPNLPKDEDEPSHSESSEISTAHPTHGDSSPLDYPTHPQMIVGSDNSGKEVVWTPSVQGSPHLLIVGIPGQGKSVTVNTLCHGLHQNGVGTLIFDFHGDYSDPEKSSFAKICQPIVWNAAQGLPFSPFEADLHDEMGQNSWKIQSWALADIFDYVCGLGDQQRDGVFQAIMECYKEVRRNPEGSLLPTIPILAKKLQAMEDRKRIRGGVVARCRPLLEMNVFNPQSEAWDILKTTKQGLVINLKEIGADTVREATSAFILRKVYKDILKWPKSSALKLAIVLDEAHRLAKDKTLPLIMQEARKFGVAVIVASQNLNHFHDNIIGNVGSKIIFRTNDPDSKKVSKMVQWSGDAKQTIEKLATGHAVIQLETMSSAKKVSMKCV